jgi:hypothetical protein
LKDVVAVHRQKKVFLKLEQSASKAHLNVHDEDRGREEVRDGEDRKG